MSEIIKEVGEKAITVKTRRSALAVAIDMKAGTIVTYYSEQDYYINAESEEVLLGEATTSSWTGDYAAWSASDAGIEVKASIEARLILADPSAEPEA